MTFEQGLSFAIVLGAMAMFVWGRFRYDTIAVGALVLSLVTGVVKPDKAFSGFSSDVVVIIASALVISAAIARSGVVEPVVRPLLEKLKTPRTQVPVLAGATALFSMLYKNVGALATLMPIAVRMGRGEKSTPTQLLMPMSFMSLLGGLVTLVGTSTNIIASQVREQTTGHPFNLFDFAPVGLTLTALGFLFVSFGWRLLPKDREPQVELGEINAETAYATEVRVPDDWPEKLKRIRDLELKEAGIKLLKVAGPRGGVKSARLDTRLTPGMSLLLEGDDDTLGAFLARVPLLPPKAESDLPKPEQAEELRTIEVIVEPRSPIVGRSAESLQLQSRYHTKLLAISRRGETIRQRLQKTKFRAGDLLVLQANEGSLPETLRSLGALPMAEREIKLGNRRERFGPILILVAAVVLIAAKLLTVAGAFFAAAFLMVAIGSISMREAYGSLEPEVLVLIGALTPLSEAIHANGGTELIAGALSGLLGGLPSVLVIGALMLAAMICSPLLHNAPTVLVLAPLGATLFAGLHLNPDAALMAVATGAGCDFITPIGHQSNTLVRGPGGYRFGDYIRLGAPLSVMILLAGAPAIAFFWL